MEESCLEEKGIQIGPNARRGRVRGTDWGKLRGAPCATVPPEKGMKLAEKTVLPRQGKIHHCHFKKGEKLSFK